MPLDHKTNTGSFTFQGVRRLIARRSQIVTLVAIILSISIAIASVTAIKFLTDRPGSTAEDMVALEYRFLLREAALSIDTMRTINSAMMVDESVEQEARNTLQDLYDAELTTLEKKLKLTGRIVDNQIATVTEDEFALTKYQIFTVLLIASGLLLLLLWATIRSRRMDHREHHLLDRLQRSSRRYHLAVDSAQVGVFERSDMTNDRSYWSPKLYELLRVARSEPPGPLLSLVHPDYLSLLAETRDKILQTRQSAQLQAPLLCGDGEYRWFAMNAVAHGRPGTDVLGVSGTITSIDRLKEAKTLVQSEQKLQSSVQMLTNINIDLEQFSRLASHDLQEPLRMITSFTELLEEDYGSQLDAQGLEYIQFASDGAKRMQAMLHGLMRYAKESRRKATPEWVDINQLIEDVLRDLHSVVDESGVTLDIQQIIPPVVADKVGLTCILRNLISNAIKYRRSDEPRVEIRFFSSAEQWTLSVKDNGIGIEQKLVQQIFQPFRRLHGKDEYGGDGIGLSLCNRIASSWRASLDVQSTPGEGSTFILTAPMLNRHYRVKAA